MAGYSKQYIAQEIGLTFWKKTKFQIFFVLFFWRKTFVGNLSLLFLVFVSSEEDHLFIHFPVLPKVIIEKSCGEVSLMNQDTIENVS